MLAAVNCWDVRDDVRKHALRVIYRKFIEKIFLEVRKAISFGIAHLAVRPGRTTQRVIRRARFRSG